MFEIATTNLKMAREKRDSKEDPKPIQLQPGDTVLVKITLKDHLIQSILVIIMLY